MVCINLSAWKNIYFLIIGMKMNYPSKVVPNSFGQDEEELIEQFQSSNTESLRPVDNTVDAIAKRKNRKSLLAKGGRHGQYVEDQNSKRFEASGDIIEDSGFIQDTGSKFHPPTKTKNADILLNLGNEEYDVLDDGSQGNYTIQSNQNFKGEIKQANKIKLLEWKDSVDSGVQSVKLVQNKPTNPSKSNKSIKSIKSIPVSQYCFDRTSIFERLSKGYTMQFQIHRDKKALSGMTEYHILVQDSKKHVLTVRKEGVWEYVFYLRDAKGSYIRIATLQSSFLSSRFTLIRDQQKFSNATICYQSNFLGLSGPRRMHIYLPKTEVPFKYLDECYGELNWREKIEKCLNKQPKWSEEEKSYVLSFKGRAKESSIKNFVITDAFECEDKFFLIFGKSGAEIYNLDIEYPFSIVQGLAVAMTTFETKITCD